jgi:hypothetical protein
VKNFAPSITVRALLLSLCFASLPAAGAELWVSPAGADSNPGTYARPFASLDRAQSEIRKRRVSANTNDSAPLKIILRGGTYPLTKTFRLRPEDSDAATGPLLLTAAPGETPVLSGAAEIAGWKPAANVPGLPQLARGKVWMADLPRINGRFLTFRQLWVNDSKAMRAREPNQEMTRLVAWDKTNQVAVIPAAALAGVKIPAHLEMIVDQVWEIAMLRVKSIRIQGTNAFLTFEQPESNLEFQHPWPPVTVNTHYQAPFFLANAIEFLDSPGEWFADFSRGKIYYWPRPAENMARARVFAPTLETLVDLEGTPDHPVANLRFQGITFAHAGWLRPSEQGHVPLQAGMPLLRAQKLSPKGTAYDPGLDNLAWIGRPPAAVSLKNTGGISFENCTFEHLGSAGLDFQTGTRGDSVAGCVFRDLGGNGIQLGKFSDTNVETHIPFLPPDDRRICSHEKISNNLITDCGNEDWGCVGIAIGYARYISVEHNDISHLPYTGISVGWGWTKATNCLRDNFIFANRIHDVGRRMGDLGGIYTLSAQPGTVVAENSISNLQPGPYVPDPRHWFYLYLDEGSSFITVRDNWCPAEKFFKNANGPGNQWLNNGPQVSARIKDAAGLEPAFQFLLQNNPAPQP